MTPEELGAAIDAKSAAAVTALLLTASEPERIRCASVARKRLGRPSDWYANYSDLAGTRAMTEDERERAIERYNQRVRDRRHEAAVPALAVLGTARSPRQAAQALNMIDNDTEQQAVTVLAQRPSAWLADFCEQAFASQSGAPVTEWRLVRALVRAGHVTRPRSPSYISAMPFGLTHFDRPDRPLLRDALLADPALLQEEIFELFTVDEAGAVLLRQDNHQDKSHWHHDGSTHPERTWRVALAGLAADGHIDRDRLLDACLGAFFRDFPASQLTWYLRLHEELAPDTDELATRSGRYLRLLAADAGTAVGLGQKAITTLLNSGRIDPAEIVAASGPVLVRREKKYAVAQLRLLDTVTREHPDLAEGAVEAASAAFEHPLAEVQERALELVARCDSHVGPAAAEKLRSAASSLAPSLRSRAEAVLGGGSGPEPVPVPAPPVPATAPAVPAGPPRLASLGEFASTAAALAADPWNPLLAEQVIDGIARFAADRAAFTAALAPLARHLEGPAVSTDEPSLRALTWFLEGAVPEGDMLQQLRAWRWAAGGGRRTAGLTPRALLADRIWETCTRSADGEARRLLAYPDTAAGHVDPERIVAEVAAMEDAGTEPWPADLTQALLRLPRSADEQVIAAAARLRSGAGCALADVLRRGAVPDPLTELGHDSRGVLLVNSGVPGVAPVKMRPDPEAPVTEEPLPAIWELREYDDVAWPARELLVWAHALPSHREVVAAHALQVMSRVDFGLGWMRPDVRFVAGLPDMQGPAGPAVVLTVAYSLFAHDPAQRAAAVEALTGFAQRGGIGGTAVGRMLGEMKAVWPGRVAECLRSAAADPAARPLAWQIASAAIPGILRSGTRDTHRLLSVTADLAVQLGVRADIDGLAQAAAAKGSTSLAKEARRLHALM